MITLMYAANNYFYLCFQTDDVVKEEVLEFGDDAGDGEGAAGEAPDVVGTQDMVSAAILNWDVL